jgi:DNA-directed RNA polymerase specialized sigma24 family protein
MQLCQDRAGGTSYIDSLSMLFSVDEESEKMSAHDASELMKSFDLPQEFIDVIILHAFEGKKISQIAMDTGNSSSVISQRFLLARYHLVRRMQKRLSWELIKRFDLSDMQRTVCELYFSDLLKTTDVAKKIGMKAAQVSTTINRVKIKMVLAMWALRGGDGECRWLNFEKAADGIGELREEMMSSARKRRDFQMLGILTDTVSDL